MKLNEREEKILEILRSQHFAGVRHLAELLYTSPSSIRRDLTHMQQEGLVRRNYGGVMLCDTEHTAAPVSVRLEANKAAKRQIASKAASLLRDQMTVFLDGSTTASYLTEHLAEHSGITVFTNSLQTASALIAKQVDTYCIGGHAVGGSHVMAGNYAEDMVANLYADLFFFSSFALSDSGMISDCTAEENSLRRRMLQHADTRVFLCDSSKFHRTAAHRLCTLKDVDAWFSEDTEDAEPTDTLSS